MANGAAITFGSVALKCAPRWRVGAVRAPPWMRAFANALRPKTTIFNGECELGVLRSGFGAGS